MEHFNSYKKKFQSSGVNEDELMRKYMLRMLEEEFRAFEAIQNAEASATAVSAASAGGPAPSAGTPTGNFVTSGLVLNYDLTNPASYPGSGNVITNLVQSSGSAYNLYLYNGPTFVSSNGGFMRFDGVDDAAVASQTINFSNSYGSQPASLFDPSTTDFSMGGWFRMRTLPGGSLPFFDIVGSGASDQFMFTDSNGVLGFFDRQIFTWNFYYQTSPSGFIQANTWYHIMHVKQGNSKRWYLNGENVYNYTAVTHPTETYHITLGVYIDDLGFAPVDVGQAYLYNTALTGDQVTNNFNFARSRYGI